MEPARNQLYCNATNSVANDCQLIGICLATPRPLFKFAGARFKKTGITVYLVPKCFYFFENNSFKSDFFAVFSKRLGLEYYLVFLEENPA